MVALVAAIHVFRAASQDVDGQHNRAGHDDGVEAAWVNVSGVWYQAGGFVTEFPWARHGFISLIVHQSI